MLTILSSESDTVTTHYKDAAEITKQCYSEIWNCPIHGYTNCAWMGMQTVYYINFVTKFMVGNDKERKRYKYHLYT